MKLWYLHYAGKIWTSRLWEDGHIELFQWLTEHGVVDGVQMRVDTCGTLQKDPLLFGAVTVEFSNGVGGFDPAPGDVIWIRGGWKGPWLDWLRQIEPQRNWFIFYDSNTGRWRWPYWHVVLNDLDFKSWITPKTSSAEPKLWLYYPKPINSIFQYHPGTPMSWDICINSSYCYDRKGQWIAYKVLLEHERIFGRRLRCAIPGGTRYIGPKTHAMFRDIVDGGHTNFVHLRHIPRDKLAQVLNSTRLYLATTLGGYGDRAPVEAGMCGCPLVVFFPGGSHPYHSAYVLSNHEITLSINELLSGERYTDAAREIERWLAVEDEVGTDARRAAVAKHFESHVALDNGAGPVLSKVFSFMRRHPQSDRALLPAMLEEATA